MGQCHRGIRNATVLILEMKEGTISQGNRVPLKAGKRKKQNLSWSLGEKLALPTPRFYPQNAPFQFLISRTVKEEFVFFKLLSV